MKAPAKLFFGFGVFNIVLQTLWLAIILSCFIKPSEAQDNYLNFCYIKHAVASIILLVALVAICIAQREMGQVDAGLPHAIIKKKCLSSAYLLILKGYRHEFEEFSSLAPGLIFLGVLQLAYEIGCVFFTFFSKKHYLMRKQKQREARQATFVQQEQKRQEEIKQNFRQDAVLGHKVVNLQVLGIEGLPEDSEEEPREIRKNVRQEEHLPDIHQEEKIGDFEGLPAIDQNEEGPEADLSQEDLDNSIIAAQMQHNQ